MNSAKSGKYTQDIPNLVQTWSSKVWADVHLDSSVNICDKGNSNEEQIVT